jgi:hypothetical protein
LAKLKVLPVGTPLLIPETLIVFAIGGFIIGFMLGFGFG